MSESSMKYYILTEESEEYGPIPQETLEEWAKSGRVGPHTQVRNSMLKSWKDAQKISFLKELIAEAANKNQGAKKPSNSGPPKALHSSSDSIKAGKLSYRFGALMVDFSVFVFILFVIAASFKNPMETQAISQDICLSILIVSTLIIPIFYYTLTEGLFGQTFGQMLFGIMAVKAKDEPVFLGRAFIFSVLFIFLLPIQPIFLYILKKTLNEHLTGVNIVNVKMG